MKRVKIIFEMRVLLMIDLIRACGVDPEKEDPDWLPARFIWADLKATSMYGVLLRRQASLKRIFSFLRLELQILLCNVESFSKRANGLGYLFLFVR